jgi:hypothetical protein
MWRAWGQGEVWRRHRAHRSEPPITLLRAASWFGLLPKLSIVPPLICRQARPSVLFVTFGLLCCCTNWSTKLMIVYFHIWMK